MHMYQCFRKNTLLLYLRDHKLSESCWLLSTHLYCIVAVKVYWLVAQFKIVNYFVLLLMLCRIGRTGKKRAWYSLDIIRFPMMGFSVIIFIALCFECIGKITVYKEFIFIFNRPCGTFSALVFSIFTLIHLS